MNKLITDPASTSKSNTRDTYQVVVKPGDKRMRVVFAGATIADSADAVVLYETRLPAVYYFPRKDVRMDLLQRTEHRTHCPFKGNASYWSLEIGNQRADNVVWSYEEPLQEAQAV